jgi:hypothetical protein
LYKTMAPSLQKRLSHQEKVEAIRKLQQLHLDRRAAMLKNGLENELSRLRGVMHTTAPYHTVHMSKTIPKLAAKLKKLNTKKV